MAVAADERPRTVYSVVSCNSAPFAKLLRAIRRFMSLLLALVTLAVRALLLIVSGQTTGFAPGRMRAVDFVVSRLLAVVALVPCLLCRTVAFPVPFLSAGVASPGKLLRAGTICHLVI